MIDLDWFTGCKNRSHPTSSDTSDLDGSWPTWPGGQARLSNLAGIDADFGAAGCWGMIHDPEAPGIQNLMYKQNLRPPWAHPRCCSSQAWFSTEAWGNQLE